MPVSDLHKKLTQSGKNLTQSYSTIQEICIQNSAKETHIKITGLDQQHQEVLNLSRILEKKNPAQTSLFPYFIPAITTPAVKLKHISENEGL